MQFENPLGGEKQLCFRKRRTEPRKEVLSLKIAIAGKGGVGKTTLAGVLARIYAAEGREILAVDADPNANLASAIGFPPEVADEITPLIKMRDLIEERTGAAPGSVGTYFKLNPRVDDIPDNFSQKYEGIKLLVMGAIKIGGTGCYCPENALVRALIGYMVLLRDEIVIMDMVAGVEHLGRGTAQGVDAMIGVVEPGRRSLKTVSTIRKLAKDLGIKRVFVVGNKIRSESDKALILSHVDPKDVLGFIPFSEEIIQADLEGVSPYDISPQLVEKVKEIRGTLEEKLKRVAQV